MTARAQLTAAIERHRHPDGSDRYRWVVESDDHITIAHGGWHPTEPAAKQALAAFLDAINWEAAR